MMRPMMIASILKKKKNIELASQMGPNTQQFLQRSRLGEISAKIVGRFFGSSQIFVVWIKNIAHVSGTILLCIMLNQCLN